MHSGVVQIRHRGMPVAATNNALAGAWRNRHDAAPLPLAKARSAGPANGGLSA